MRGRREEGGMRGGWREKDGGRRRDGWEGEVLEYRVVGVLYRLCSSECIMLCMF